MKSRATVASRNFLRPRHIPSILQAADPSERRASLGEGWGGRGGGERGRRAEPLGGQQLLVGVAMHGPAGTNREKKSGGGESKQGGGRRRAVDRFLIVIRIYGQ